MKAERAYPRFTITAKGTRWVEGGHPWIYAQEIVSAPEAFCRSLFLWACTLRLF